MKSSSLAVALTLLVAVLWTPWLRAAGGGNKPLDTGAQVRFSANDFDWRGMLPNLFAASTLPAEQGVKAMLENSQALRIFVANQVRAECRPDKGRCAAKRVGFTLDGEVSKRIDEIARESMIHSHKTVGVDFPLQGQPFAFSEIAALKSEKRQDAYFIVQFAGRSYTANDLQAKYGAPYDTNISERYSVFTYRLDSAGYTSKAVFEVDPVDGAVMKVAISLKPKKSKVHD
jgi:hypothetical protein